MKKETDSSADTSALLSGGTEMELFDQIINHSRSMISIINRDYIYERVNDTFCREHQIDRVSIVGRSLGEVWGNDTFTNSIKSRIDSCFRGETVRYEASFITPRLGQRFYEVVFRPIAGGSKGITHLLAETFDINDLRISRLEAAARQAELRKFEIFARGIAHDFNNILATLSGYSEMLAEDIPSDSPLSENVERMRGALLKAHSVVEKLLRYSRNEEKEISYTDVAEVLNETIGFIQSSLRPEIRIRSRIPRNGTAILADPVQLFRAFLNILTNAIQAMDETGGILTVTMSEEDGGNIGKKLKLFSFSERYIVLTFRDTGVGIDKSNLRRIFEPDVTVRNGGNGTGLGLPVIKEIIKEIKGEIKISSLKGKGSVFYVYLPVADQRTSR